MAINQCADLTDIEQDFQSDHNQCTDIGSINMDLIHANSNSASMCITGPKFLHKDRGAELLTLHSKQ